MTIPLTTILSESAHAPRAAIGHYLVPALLFAMAVGGLGVSESVLTRDLIQTHHTREQFGELAVLAESSPTDPAAAITGLMCDRLASVPGIRSSGGLRSDGYARIASYPDSGITSFVVTPGYLAVVGAHDIGQILIGNTTSIETGSQSGALMLLDSGARAVGVIPPVQNRTDLVDRSVLVVGGLDSLYPTCVVEFEATGFDSAIAVMPFLLRGSGVTLSYRPMFRIDGATPAMSYAARAQRFLWWPVGIFGVIAMFAAWRSRHKEYLLYRLVGWSRTDLAVTQFFEAFLVSLPGIVLALVGCVISSRGEPWAAYAGARLVALAAVTYLLASAIASLRVFLWGPEHRELQRLR